MPVPKTPSPPSYWHVPEGSIFTLADEVADLMVAIGYQVDEPEQLAVRALLPQKKNGDWAGLMSTIIAPRQNIKTSTMISCAIHDTFEQGLDVVWTAHEFKTSADAFGDFQAIIEGDDALASDVLRIRTANGNEGYDLRNGANLRVLARSGRSGRGFAKVPRLYLDEGLFLQAKMMGAITPTMGAIPNAHLVVGSSAGMLTSEVLRGIRDRGRKLNDPEFGYIEWTSRRLPCLREDCTHAPEAEGCSLDNQELLWEANPALGRRITLDFLRQQRKVLEGPSISEYMREHMSWWEDPPPVEQGTWAPMDQWELRKDSASRIHPESRVAYAIDTSWDRQTTWAVIAGYNHVGTPHIEIMQFTAGQDWVIPWMKARIAARRPVGIGMQAGRSPVSTLLEQMQNEFGDLIVTLNGMEMARSGAHLFDGITKGPLAHIGQDQLTRAVQHAVASATDIGLLDRAKSPADVSPAVAAGVALHVLFTAPEPEPERVSMPMRIR